MVLIQERYLQLGKSLRERINSDYINSLYRVNEYHFYSDDKGRFKAKVIGIKPTGELILETEKGEQKTFAFKEVTFVI